MKTLMNSLHAMNRIARVGGNHVTSLIPQLYQAILHDELSKVTKGQVQSATYMGMLTTQEYDAIHFGKNKIHAIKFFRERTKCGLKEAKDAIEAEMLRLGIGYRNSQGYVYPNGYKDPFAEPLKGNPHPDFPKDEENHFDSY